MCMLSDAARCEAHAHEALHLKMCWVLQIDDQGLVNTDPRYIAVPNTWVNPTDVRGLTFSRTPQMVSP